MVKLNFNYDITIEQLDDYKEAYELLKGKRVCLVGPSNSLDGTGLGHKIDSYDFVITVGSLPYLNYNKSDFGSRIDIAILRDDFWHYGSHYSPIDHANGVYENNIKNNNLKYIFDFSTLGANELMIQNCNLGESCTSKYLFNHFFGIQKIFNLSFIKNIYNTNISNIKTNNIKKNKKIIYNIFSNNCGILAITLMTFFELSELFICGLTFTSNYSTCLDNFYKKYNFPINKTFDPNQSANIKIHEVNINEILCNESKYISNDIYNSIGSHQVRHLYDKIFLKYLFRDSIIKKIILHSDISNSMFLINETIELKFIECYDYNLITFYCKIEYPVCSQPYNIKTTTSRIKTTNDIYSCVYNKKYYRTI